MLDFYPFTLTAWALAKILAEDLYKDQDACFWEVVKNGLAACMQDEDEWSPKEARIEIRLLDRHPLGGKQGPTLMILDRGCGFTDDAMKKYATVGPSREDRKRRPGGEHKGLSQKRMGRFATYALNGKLVEEEDFSTGFYVLSRTAAKGDVTFVDMTPDRLEQQKGIKITQIQVWAKEMGPLKNIQGSFTAVIIPNSRYTTASQIKEALLPRIPRKPELMFDLTIDGEKIHPTKPSGRVTDFKQDGNAEVYIDRAKNPEDGGIWIVDLDTGLPCASCATLGPKWLPDPLWRYELKGDIFVRGALANQDTSRGTLNPRFLKSASWSSLNGFLMGKVVTAAKALMGKDFAPTGRDDFAKTLDEVRDLLVAAYGEPEASRSPGTWSSGPRAGSHGGSHGGTKNGGGHGSAGGGKGGGGTQNGGGRLRTLSVPVDGTTYVISRRSSTPDVLAEVDPNNGTVIWLNDRDYTALPTTKEARCEHVIMKVFEAIGAYKHRDDPRAVGIFVSRRRRELLRARE